MTDEPPNPITLDERALGAAIDAYDASFPDANGITYSGMKAAIRAYMQSLQRREIPLVSKKHVRDLMVEAAKRIPLDMQYKTSAQIDAMLEAIEPYLAISKPVSVSLEKCAAAIDDITMNGNPNRTVAQMRLEQAKAALDVAGVRYAE